MSMSSLAFALRACGSSPASGETLEVVRLWSSMTSASRNSVARGALLLGAQVAAFVVGDVVAFDAVRLRRGERALHELLEEA